MVITRGGLACIANFVSIFTSSSLQFLEAHQMSKEQEPATAAGKIVMGAAAQLRDMAAPATGLHGDSLTGEWTVEDSGGSNPMKRIMCGEQKIIGWTMHPYSESFDAIKNAHNAALAAEREKGLKLLGGTVNRPDLMNE